MDIQTAQILAIVLYKIFCLIAGLLLCFMGFKLFISGIWGSAGDAEGQFGNNKIVLKKAAPGTFFVLVGGFVIGMTVYKGLAFENLPVQQGVICNEKKPALAN